MRILKWPFGIGLFLLLWGLETSLIEHFTDLLPYSRYVRADPLTGLIVDIIPIVGIVILVWKGIVNEPPSSVEDSSK